MKGRCICDPIVSGPGCCFCAVPGTCGPVLPDAQAAAAAALVVNLHGVVLSSPGGTVFQPGQVRNSRGCPALQSLGAESSAHAAWAAPAGWRVSGDCLRSRWKIHGPRSKRM